MDGSTSMAARSLGQWNAYAEAGQTHDERRRRMLEAPPELRDQVLSHLKTVKALQRKHEQKRKRAARERLKTNSKKEYDGHRRALTFGGDT